jgi:hypothetical protein
MNNKYCCTYVWNILMSIRENMSQTESNELIYLSDHGFIPELFEYIDIAHRYCRYIK